MRLTPPDQLTVVLLYVAAVLMALNEGLSRDNAVTQSIPELRMGGPWNYAPLALLILVGITWLVRSLKNPPAAVAPTEAPAPAGAEGPRGVSLHQRVLLREFLSENGSAVKVYASLADREGQAYRDVLVEAIQKAEWRSEPGSVPAIADPPAIGLAVCERATGRTWSDNRIAEALTEAGIPFEWRRQDFPDLPEGWAALLVGPR